MKASVFQVRSCLFCCIVILTILPTSVSFADEFPKGSGYIEGSLHWESRDLVGDFTNFDFVAGYDFLIWDTLNLYFGPRVGLFSETVATAYMTPTLGIYWPITVGAQIYLLYPNIFLPKGLVITGGAATDAWIYVDSVHWNPSDFQPVFVYWGVFFGLRYYIANMFHVEIRIDGGTMALWSDFPIFLKCGLLFGLDL